MIAIKQRPPKLLSEIAYRERNFPALRLARASRWARRLARVMLACLGAAVVAMVAMPWQQYVAGRGTVINFDPTQRHQTIDAPISGRIVNWRPNVYEGAKVKRGDVLFEIEVVDLDLKQRLREQLEFTQQKLLADQQIVQAYEQQLRAFVEIKQQIIVAGQQFVEMAQQKLNAARQEEIAATAAWDQSEQDRQRREQLYEKKVESRFNWELAVRRAQEADAKLKQAKAYVKAAESELAAKQAELASKTQEAQAKIDSASAVFQKSQGDLQSTRKELADIQAKQTLQTQRVKATLDGVIFKMNVAQDGQVVSQGSALLEIVPIEGERAVAIKVLGNDVPLVATRDADGKPRKVRLQFEGWPAVQFAGWPSVAVGTFGGIVSVVDATDDGTGKFRVLVVPDPEEPDWPDNEILRQGTLANGWVLLNQVPLGMELWRQVNGFPPAVSLTEPKKSDDKLLRSGK